MKKEQHRKTASKEYTAWRSMKERCLLATNPMWKNYGGRGITICDRWKNSFMAFLEDMGELPFSGAQIDRVNNDKGYFKENCRWVTRHQNTMNRRTTVVLTHNEKTKNLLEWSGETGIPYNILIQRIRRDKWTTQQVLETPCLKTRNGRNKIHSSPN